MWNGGVPIFHARLIVRTSDTLDTPSGMILKIKRLKNKITEASDWVKKYLNLIMSGAPKFIVMPIIGINRSILTSIIAHTINGLLIEIPKTQLIINMEIKTVLVNQAIIIKFVKNTC